MRESNAKPVLVCRSWSYCSPEQNCTQKDCWVIIQLIPYTLWPQWHQTACCARMLELCASFSILPLLSHTHPRCTPISTACICARPWAQAKHVFVPSLILFLPQDSLYRSFFIPTSVIPRIWEVRKRAEHRDYCTACTGLDQLSFNLLALEDSSRYPAYNCLAVSSAWLSL